MSTPGGGTASPLRVGLALWTASMIGAAIVTLTVLPQLLQQVTLPAPMWVLALASLAQSGVLFGLAAWAGARLSPAVGLEAPAVSAAVSGRPWWPPLRAQLAPGLAAGVLGGAMLVAVGALAPAVLAGVQDQFKPPLLARIVYGGIAEEVLLRWGLMTALAWLAWRFLQGREGAVRPLLVWLAIVVAALAFGAGHLPAARMLLGTLDAQVVTYVIGANTAFGVLFGFLYWRHGLESAMIAHGASHAVAWLATFMLPGASP